MGLRTTLLLVVAVALALAGMVNSRRIAFLEPRIATLRPLARELDIADPSRPAAVKLPEFWLGDDRWDVYLPAGRRYRLCLATRETTRSRTDAPKQFVPLAPGRLVVKLDQIKTARDWRLTVTAGPRRLEVVEPLDWDSTKLHLGGASIEWSTQFGPDEPMIFLSRQVMQPDRSFFSGFDPPLDGVLLWIERDP